MKKLYIIILFCFSFFECECQKINIPKIVDSINSDKFYVKDFYQTNLKLKSVGLNTFSDSIKMDEYLFLSALSNGKRSISNRKMIFLNSFFDFHNQINNFNDNRVRLLYCAIKGDRSFDTLTPKHSCFELSKDLIFGLNVMEMSFSEDTLIFMKQIDSLLDNYQIKNSDYYVTSFGLNVFNYKCLKTNRTFFVNYMFKLYNTRRDEIDSYKFIPKLYFNENQVRITNSDVLIDFFRNCNFGFEDKSYITW